MESRALEAATADGMFSIDVLVTFKGQQLAVEVDGPFHFMINRWGQAWVWGAVGNIEQAKDADLWGWGPSGGRRGKRRRPRPLHDQ